MTGERLAVVHAVEKSRLATGSVVQMMDAARGQALRGHAVAVAGPPGGDLEAECCAAGVEFLPLRLSTSLDLPSAVRLRRHLRRLRPDLVHVHKGRAHAVALLASAGLGRRPVVVVNRGVSFPLDRWNRRKYRHPRVGAVVCVAEAVRRVAVASGRLRPERAVVIHAGTDTARFDPDRADPKRVRRELGVPAEDLLVGQVSLRDWKGWRELLAAFARIAGDHPAARLLLVACSGDDRERVLGLADGLEVAGRVLTLPARRDMPEVLAACDVVADASWAGTGITGSVREAMALRRAVVASDVGGNSELVVDGEVGLLVPPRDVGALAAALDRLLADPELRARLGAAARRRVVEHFSTGHRLDRLEALYRHLLAEAGRTTKTPRDREVDPGRRRRR